MKNPADPLLKSAIWQERANPDNPYCAEQVRCSGYDVYGDLLGKASYIEYLYLLFKGARPTPPQALAFELLAIALANPGPRDLSVHAAMAACVGDQPAAATLCAALAVGAGSYEGAREVLLMGQFWQQRGTNLELWCQLLRTPPLATRNETFPAIEHAPGFAPYDEECRMPVLQSLQKLAQTVPDGKLAWLAQHRAELEQAAGRPLSMMGVAATALADLEFTPKEAEMLTLLLRLPGAAAHALEQAKLGFRQFPFFTLDLQNDPGPAAR